MRQFYLHTRNGMYYAELIDPNTGKKLTARSTGTKNRDEALLRVADWLKNGMPGRKTFEAAAGIEAAIKYIRRLDIDSDDAMKIVQILKNRQLIDFPVIRAGKGSVLFTDYLVGFWDYDNSPYIKEKLAHGQSIGKRHSYECNIRIARYWLPAFQGRTLNSITRQDLKDFSLSLAGSGLAPATVNKVMDVGTTCLSWAYREGLIPADPTSGLASFSGQAKKRGVLTQQEAATLFSSPWKDKRAYAASLLSATTGLRSGEALALKLEDIEGQVLNVRHSWSDFDGLKTPKNGETRRVPLLPEVKEKLLELARENPYGPGGFIFYGTLADKPIDQKVLLKGLQKALAAIGIDAPRRGIVFHSWRHYYAARMADRLTADQVSRITGHKSRAVFEEYADHITEENLAEVGRVGAEVFENILQYRKGA